MAHVRSIYRNRSIGPKNGKPYLDGLAKAKAAILFIGGSRDGMAPHATSAEVCSASNPGGERRCVVAGKESGFAADYGHLDLMLGKRSKKRSSRGYSHGWKSTTQNSLKQNWQVT